MNSRTIAIINSLAGASMDDGAGQRLHDIIELRKLNWQICSAKNGSEISALARWAAQTEANVVVAGGGDGTLSEVASYLAGTEKLFGVLPLGTLNHFAKDLDIPLELGAAVDNIAAGNTVAIDVGEVNGRVFLNNSSIGLYPRVVAQREAQRKYGRSKWLALFSAVLRTLQQYAAFRVYVTADGKRFTRRTPILFVGNNEYQIEGRALGARHCLNRGRLCLYVLHHTGPWGLLKFAVRALFRRAWRIKDFDALHAREIDVELRRSKTRVAIDGELFTMESPLRYRIRQGALKVIVPAAKDSCSQAA